MAKKTGALPPNPINMVAEGTVLDGVLRARGDVRISGHIIGAVEATSRVVVTSAGLIEGTVAAAAADIAGAIEGDLDVAAHLVLRSGARVEGAIEAGKLVVEDGAVFNGSCRIVQSRENPAKRDGSHRPPPVHPPLWSEPPPRRVARSIPNGPEPSMPHKVSTASSGQEEGSRRAILTVFGIFLVIILATGAYYGLGGIPGEAIGRSGETEEQRQETSEIVTDVRMASVDRLDTVSLLPASETVVEAVPDAPSLGDPARQTAGLDRIAMEYARQRIFRRRTEPPVAALYQQGEAARQAGMNQNEAGDFEQAWRSFRAARARYVQMQQVLGEEANRAQEAPAEPTTEAPADVPEDGLTETLVETPAVTTTEEPVDTTPEMPASPTPEAPEDPVAEAPAEAVPEEDEEATLKDVQTVVRRLARQLKLTIEQEDVASMGALYYRGWAPFFEEAEGITAVVRPENVRLTGTEAIADVYLDLAYQDAENQSQQRAQVYVWTLMRLGDEWVLRRVSSP